MRYLGDKLILLSSQDGAKLSEVFEANVEGLSKLFEEIKPWCDGLTVGNKEVWTRCRGLPLHLWTANCFRKVLHRDGSLVEIDEATLNWEHVEFARL